MSVIIITSSDDGKMGANKIANGKSYEVHINYIRNLVIILLLELVIIFIYNAKTTKIIDRLCS